MVTVSTARKGRRAPIPRTSSACTAPAASPVDSPRSSRFARGATVVATAGPSSEARVRGYGAHLVLDYHDPDWPARVREASPGGRGVAAAVNAARGDAATAVQAVADNGDLATITGDPPPPERGIAVADVYVRADGARLAELVAALADGQLSLHVAATLPLTDAATALQTAVTGHAAGATVLALEQSPEP